MPFKDDGQFITTRDGVKIYFEVDGAQNSEPLFIIAGVGGSEETFNHVANQLKSKYKVIKHDGRGIGLSDMPEGDITIDMLVNEVIDVLDALQIKTVNLLGHSLGGMIAQELYNKYPERVKSIILASTLVGYSDPQCVMVAPDVMDDLNNKTAFPEDPEFEQKMLAAAWLYFDKSFAETAAGQADILEMTHINQARSTTDGILKRGVPGWTYSNSANLANIKVPVLVIQGENDYLVPAKNADIFEQRIPNCKKVLIPHCGHHPFVEHCELFVKTVDEFLQSLA